MDTTYFIEENENLPICFLGTKKNVPGFKARKSCLTLLLFSSSTLEDLKSKPLFTFHLEIVTTKGNIKMNQLVIWKVWVTKDIFMQWFVLYFCLTVKRYCEEHNLEHKALLMIDYLQANH